MVLERVGGLWAAQGVQNLRWRLYVHHALIVRLVGAGRPELEALVRLGDKFVVVTKQFVDGRGMLVHAARPGDIVECLE